MGVVYANYVAIRYIHVNYLTRTKFSINYIKYEIYAYKILRNVNLNPTVIKLGMHKSTISVSRR